MTSEELNVRLEALQRDLTEHNKKIDEEVRAQGLAAEETRAALAAIKQQIAELDARTAGVIGSEKAQPVADIMREHDGVRRLVSKDVKSAGLTLTGRNAQDFFARTFTAASSAGFATSGVYQIDRTPGIVLEARPQLRIRDLIPSRPTSLAYVDYVKVNSAIQDASPQGPEGTKKFENSTTLTTVSKKIQTIATFIRVSEQALADFDELAGYINGALRFAVDKEIDAQLLSGAGTGANLSGLTTNAASFNTALLPSASQGYTYIDTIGAAFAQVDASDEIASDFVVLHPADAWRIRLTKDGDKRYLFGDPQSAGPFTIWGKQVATTTQMAVGSFLVGTSSPAAAEIRDRAEVRIELSREDADNFTENLVTIRAEARLALATYRPDAFVYGSLASSPAF